MATSCLFIGDGESRYTKAYKLLENSMLVDPAALGKLPILDKAISAVKAALKKIKASDPL
jgi:hypothetical protein